MSRAAEVREEILRAVDLSDVLGEERPLRYEVEIRGRLSRGTVEEISRAKGEPEWMRSLRLSALEYFYKLPNPRWIPWIESLDLEKLVFYSKPSMVRVERWEDLPKEVRDYFDRLGLPEIEKRYLAGLIGILDSEPVYAKMKGHLEKLGVVVLPMEEALRRYPDLVRKYFGRVFPYTDHKFAALHYALWSGGTFIYVPPGVKVREPLESFFLIGRSAEGQFEHSLIVVDEGAEVTWIEGCSAPRLASFSFHDGAVEVYAARNARVKIVTIQNWSRDVVNFNNKRAVAEEGAVVEWIEGGIGSRVTYTYPSTVLRGDGGSTSIITVQLAKGRTVKDSGGKAIHAGRNTRSRIVSKSISADGGISVYRGLVRIQRGAYNSVSNVECESLILDEKSKAYTYPHNHVEEPSATVSHEARTGRLDEAQLFYLQSRGLSEDEAKALIVLGYLEDVMRNLPAEYVFVLSRVIQLEFKEVGGYG